MGKPGTHRRFRFSEIIFGTDVTTYSSSEIKHLTEELKADIVRLRERKETAHVELGRAKKREMQTEKLKGAATTAATNISERVDPLFGRNKVRTLEGENKALYREVAAYEETFEILQGTVQTMQTNHSREVLEMLQQHSRKKAGLCEYERCVVFLKLYSRRSSQKHFYV